MAPAGSSPGLSAKAVDGARRWLGLFHISIRSDLMKPGVKFVPDKAAAIVEGQHLETLGYVVTRIAESPHAVARSAAGLA